jgi:chlorite dismutase
MTSGPETTPIDIRERGADRDGQPVTLDRRLFFQLLCFSTRDTLAPPAAARALESALGPTGVGSVLYEDVNHPRGFALLTFSEAPEDFVIKVRPALAELTSSSLAFSPELTMIGRTYSSGFEQDLEYWLLRRPRETVLNPAWPWAIWYPLRRKGGFDRLEPRERGGVLREHGSVGRSYGEADLAHDVRLACHGLDRNDNDFVIGLVGKSLHPLSHVVQAMRSTRQTAEYMEKMGPFFVGRSVFRLPGFGA